MAYGKDAAQISSQTTFAKRDYIDARAARMSPKPSRSDMLSAIVDFWFAVGAPPLFVGEAALPHLPVPSKATVEITPLWEGFVSLTDDELPSAQEQAIRLLRRLDKKRSESGASEQSSNHAQ